MVAPGFLVVGHVTKDVTATGYELGGGATFAALAALRLGQRVALLTRAEPEVAARLGQLLAGVEVLCLPSACTTTFRNEYVDGRRRQYVLAVAPPLGEGDLPAEWRAAPVVLLAPVAGELPATLAQHFPQALLGLALQGWLRQQAADGRVSPAPWPDGTTALARADLAVLSVEDVASDLALVDRYAAQARLLALTQGAGGATLYWQGQRYHSPALPAREVDPTGAGDVFAAAFLVAYAQCREPLSAARFAHAAASFAVEAPGTAGIATREQVEARLAQVARSGAPSPFGIVDPAQRS